MIVSASSGTISQAMRSMTSRERRATSSCSLPDIDGAGAAAGGGGITGATAPMTVFGNGAGAAGVLEVGRGWCGISESRGICGVIAGITDGTALAPRPSEDEGAGVATVGAPAVTNG